ncbi:unnamed protein product [Miscanthus lutarioriparius]|uniref:Eukaryotic translation initiation factor 3 subunit E N-terminal domain-containing protein n=1 Tax=Miscanthus lutarioriparius TaxID=422564 RepID=A0A811ME69_9POAL|nr:unnamed protein product [Miscanthus lutarioriparius]
MAEHDLTALMAAQLDRHLVFPLLEFLQERQLYSEPEFPEAKIRLLSGTNTVDYAMDIHKSLHGTDDVPEDMVKRRAEVVSRLRSLEEATAPLVAFLQNPQLVQELRPDKQYNIHMLQERYQFDPAKLKKLHPSFKENGGTVTGACDGAAALVLVSGQKAQELGLQVLARIRGYADAAQCVNRNLGNPANPSFDIDT